MTTDAHEPFDALRLDAQPAAPRAEFAADLRRRLAAALSDTALSEPDERPITQQGARTMSNPSAMTPATTSTGAADDESPAAASVTVVPYLAVHDGAAALDFYRVALGAVEDHRMVGDDGRIGHSEFRIGGARFSLSDEYPEMGVLGPRSRGGSTCSFQLYVPDVDAAFERAVSHGAAAGRPPADQFHGNRTADFVDPFGQRWMLIAPLAAMSDDEYAAAGAAQGFTVERSPAAASVAEHSQAKELSTGDLYYFTIPVTDLAKAQVFFGAVLGWQFDDPQAGHVSNISAPPGGVRAAADMPGTRLWFVVDDIHDAVAAVRAHGGSADEPVEYESGWSADCVDDQGTPFSLSVPADKYRL